MQCSWRLFSWACLALVFACTGTDSADQGILAAGAGGSTSAGSPAPAGMSGGAAGTSAAAAGSGGAGSGTAGVAPPPAGIGGSAVVPDAGMAGAAGGDAAMGDAATAPDACDRACLIEVMSAYLTALAAKNSAALPVSMSLKYTDNGATAELGSGLWQTASGLRMDTRLDFADPQEGQVASQLVLDENGSTPVIYQVRLKVVAHEITEIESMTVRQRGAANGFFSVPGMTPQPVFRQAIEASKRLTRAQLKTEVDLYLDYLDGETGASGVHFDAACARYENGQVTASGLSSFERQSWSFDVVRRYLVFDEEAGIVWGMFPFSQAARALVVGEAFKVIDGKIMMIQAVMANQPTNAWE